MEHVCASLHCYVLYRELLYAVCWYVVSCLSRWDPAGEIQDVEFGLRRKCTVVKSRCIFCAHMCNFFFFAFSTLGLWLLGLYGRYFYIVILRAMW